jgi:hypothetical protein
MNGFDVGIYAIRRRPGRRRPFGVRWRAGGKVRSRSFLTWALADSYRAELVRAARTGLEFDPAVRYMSVLSGLQAARRPEIHGRRPQNVPTSINPRSLASPGPDRPPLKRLSGCGSVRRRRGCSVAA